MNTKDILFNELKKKLEVVDVSKDNNIFEEKSLSSTSSANIIVGLFILLMTIVLSALYFTKVIMLGSFVKTYIILIILSCLAWFIMKSAGELTANDLEEATPNDFNRLIDSVYLKEYREEILKLVRVHYGKYGFVSEYVFYLVDEFNYEMESLSDDSFEEMNEKEIINHNNKYLK